MNEIIGDHNVDKQMTDSRGDVSSFTQRMMSERQPANCIQVAYLMADISNLDNATIKDLYERLESLSCKTTLFLAKIGPKNSNTCVSPNHDPDSVLDKHLDVLERAA